MVLAPTTDAGGIHLLASRILDAVVALKVPHPATQRGIVTVSIGGATCPAGVRIVDATLIEQADRALYLAKAEGRNTFRFLPQETL